MIKRRWLKFCSLAEEMPGKGKYAELTKISASRVKKIMQTNDEV